MDSSIAQAITLAIAVLGAALGGEKLPVRLETRTSCTALASLATFENVQLASINRAYANTACGNQIEGDSAALRQIVNAALAAQE